jgi:hypothetical protein
VEQDSAFVFSTSISHFLGVTHITVIIVDVSVNPQRMHMKSNGISCTQSTRTLHVI